MPRGTVISVHCRPWVWDLLRVTLSCGRGCAAFSLGLSHIATLTNTKGSVTEDERVWLLG